jgi:hypothetical protein
MSFTGVKVRVLPENPNHDLGCGRTEWPSQVLASACNEPVDDRHVLGRVRHVRNVPSARQRPHLCSLDGLGQLLDDLEKKGGL